jgi:hypothetical protein
MHTHDAGGERSRIQHHDIHDVCAYLASYSHHEFTGTLQKKKKKKKKTMERNRSSPMADAALVALRVATCAATAELAVEGQTPLLPQLPTELIVEVLQHLDVQSLGL